MNPGIDLKKAIKEEAFRLGFSAVGIASAEYDPVGHDHLNHWLDSGYQAQMGFMERSSRKRFDPRSYLPNAHSVIVCALNYYTPPMENEKNGYISIYARGRNYHYVVENKLIRLREKIVGLCGEFDSKVSVDTLPMAEKAWAIRSGIGFQGKNGVMILPGRKSSGAGCGSFHFLGLIITDLKLDPDTSIKARCGKCRKCIDACPTGAIVADRVIDANKCISYHTIENRGTIDEDIANKMGNMVHGCDICQLVCPFNKNAQVTSEPSLMPRKDLVELDMEKLMKLSEEEFKNTFADNVIIENGYAAFRRNIMIAMKNLGR